MNRSSKVRRTIGLQLLLKGIILVMLSLPLADEASGGRVVVTMRPRHQILRCRSERQFSVWIIRLKTG